MSPAALRLGTTVRVRGIGERTPATLVVTAVRGPYRPRGPVILVGYTPGDRARRLHERTVGADANLEVIR